MSSNADIPFVLEAGYIHRHMTWVDLTSVKDDMRNKTNTLSAFARLGNDDTVIDKDVLEYI